MDWPSSTDLNLLANHFGPGGGNLAHDGAGDIEQDRVSAWLYTRVFDLKLALRSESRPHRNAREAIEQRDRSSLRRRLPVHLNLAANLGSDEASCGANFRIICQV